jgi:hypothetical protein
MHEVSRQPANEADLRPPKRARSLTLRGVPHDVVAAIKRGVTEHNIAHPEAPIGQTEVVAAAVREWADRGGQLRVRSG